MSTKQKVESVRTYDKDGYRRRAACVCIRDQSQKEVLLVSTNHDPDLWIVPGGGVEPAEDMQEAAVREVLEEAGVKGTISACLGLFESNECRHRTMVYLMVVNEQLNDWQEAISIGRKRRWFTMEEARLHLGQHRPSHRLYLDTLPYNKPDILVNSGNSGEICSGKGDCNGASNCVPCTTDARKCGDNAGRCFKKECGLAKFVPQNEIVNNGNSCNGNGLKDEDVDDSSVAKLSSLINTKKIKAKMNENVLESSKNISMPYIIHEDVAPYNTELTGGEVVVEKT